MAKPVLGKSLRSDWFFLSRDFAVWTDWNFTEISKMDEEDEHSPSEVSIILNIWKFLMQKLKAASSKARRAKTILSTIRKFKHKQVDGYWYELSFPLHWR